LKISLSDVDRIHYDTLHLTVAQHPSETNERIAAQQQRTMQLSVTIAENSAYIATESGGREVSWEPLWPIDPKWIRFAHPNRQNHPCSAAWAMMAHLSKPFD